MLDDPLFIALLARAGGNLTISAAELKACEGASIVGSRNPKTGDVTLSIKF